MLIPVIFQHVIQHGLHPPAHGRPLQLGTGKDAGIGMRAPDTVKGQILIRLFGIPVRQDGKSRTFF